MNSNTKRLKRQIRDNNQTVCVSNATNSRSPNDLKSRIFIGNLNTNVITKRHLHLIFIPFGAIKAISMHKGYAFIQFDDQMDALNAVLAQDGQMIAGQAIDVNLVTEPKPHQKSSKTSTVSNESETNGELTTETNSMENSIESDVNYTNFENSMTDMRVESDCVTTQRNHSELNQICDSDADVEDKQMNVCLSEVQNSKRVRLDSNADMASETTTHSNQISSQKNRNYENDSQYSTDESSRRSDSMTTNADNGINKQLMNSTDNNCYYLNEHNLNGSSMSSLLSNPSLSLLLSNTNQRLSQENLPLAVSQVQQTYDILICGNCRTFFTSLPLFIQHKRSSKCRLRFVCHCQQK